MRTRKTRLAGKLLFMLIAVAVVPMVVVAQSATPAAVGEPNPTEIGVDTAQQKLKEVSISKFEDAGFWSASMSKDEGLVTLRRLAGSPIDKEPLEAEAQAGITEDDSNVLGIKVEYFKRGNSQFTLTPVRPMPVEGICKTVSVWVVGRNSPHVLKMLLSDHFGNRAEVTMGKLNFTGWKKLTVAIPTSIVQRDYHYNNKMGIKIEGFTIDCDPKEAYGSYYIYFDDLRATTDLFAEEHRDIDDMQDNW
ncbi:flagellar filament outer layer protein FlaA [Sediminispirochaeta bajacaliforniensis]|uniref:flagellar filament outer layer protein FlaA n=1 Tax=Sediminispirochaeta bajacaliforniensis TaxID=148 RepID=UPI00036D79AD|nr:flagellar filament outer layer protein FlaA [Sediminispirochaeta bajacaliforniensis]